MRLRVEGLERRFGDLTAVDGISFTLPPGEIWGFVGPNGAGKTTTLRILATLDEPSAGDAFLDGVSIVEEPEVARRAVGFMPDALPLHSDMRVVDYLDFFARAYGLRGGERRRRVAQVSEFTRLAPLAEKKVAALSKGMKQRVSLARALVHDPGILLLDEPAAGLDPRARVELRELMRLLAAQGKSILVSSHILAELSEICDGAVILELGEVVRAGSVASLETSPVAILRLRCADGDLDLERFLLEQPETVAVRPVGRELEVEITGDQGVIADLLRRLVGAGFPVVEFRQRSAGLEEVFLSATRGAVQ